MRYLVLAAMAACLALAPSSGQAAPKKMSRVHHAQPHAPAAQDPAESSAGNAAAGGNNANSMSGSNSAAENANGRSSGGFGGN
jgi:hypothetical protein